MIWVGALIGIILGFAFESFPLGFLFFCVGCFTGILLNRRRKQDAQALELLKQRVSALEKQNGSLERRVTQLEAAPQRSFEKNLQADVVPPAPQNTPSSEAPAAQAHAVVPDAPLIPESEIAAALTLLQPEPPEVGVTPDTAIPEPVLMAQVQTRDPQQAPAQQPVRPQSAAVSRPQAKAPPAPKAPRPPSALELKLKQLIFGGNPLVKVGVLILFLGLAFLLRYASEFIVIPVELRYAGVAAAGVALLLTGWRLRHKKDNYGLILQGAGIAVMYLTPLSAMRISNLMPPQVGFAVLLAVAVFAAMLAVLQDSLAMAIAGTLGGFAAPVLVSTGHDAHLGLFLFLAVLNVGIASIAWFKAWRVLNLIGFTGTFLLGAGWAEKFYEARLFAEVEPFLLLFFALYVLIAFLFARRVLIESGAAEVEEFGKQMRQSAAQLNYVDGTLVFGTPFLCFAMQYLLVQPYPYGAAFSALGFGLFYAGLAMLLFRKSGRRAQLLSETLLALGVIFGSLAIPLGLDQTWTSAAWAVEAGGMYWIALKQERQHGRAFALLVLLASALTSLSSLREGEDAIALHGSTMGFLLLAASAAWICLLMRRAKSGLIPQDEANLRPAVMIVGALFLALAPFTALPTQWASSALALTGVGVLYLALRWSEKLLQTLGWLYQAIAGAIFIATLHAAAGDAALGSGSGIGETSNIGSLVLVSLIGACMLASVWFALRKGQAGKKSDQEKAPRVFGPVASIALLAGIAFVNLAPLFVLSLGHAALIWTLSGLATLWWALRVQHIGAILLGLILQVLAGIAHLSARLLIPVYVAYDPHAVKPFMHSGFWGPVLISLASLLCARLLARGNPDEGKTSAVNRVLGWISLMWSVVWWGFGWSGEVYRVMAVDTATPAMLALVMLTALAWSLLAKRWRWPDLGQLTLLYVPSLALVAVDAALSGIAHPLVSWAILAWPLALLMHGLLLKWQASWVDIKSGAGQTMHVAGAWLFVILAADELRWHFAQMGEEDSAWRLLGWMIAPVAYLLLLTVKRVQQAWPVRDHMRAYQVVSALPIVIYLGAWVWISNIASDGNAAPLPYVPLLNPLEIAQCAVLLGAFLWWWPQRETPALRSLSGLFIGAAMATGFAMLTGMVARSCHHWGGVAWNGDDLWQSTAFQTALSIAWSLTAISLMLTGNRRKHRWIWIVGAVLMGVVVLKLFLVELAAHGTLARIVSFIVVGMLLLLVGYFAPLPPRRQNETAVQESETA